MQNSIAKHFTTFSLLRFAAPSVITMIFMSLYTMVDGMFVSRFVNTTALSAINIALPFTNLGVGIGVMLGTGGSAVVARQMGEEKNELANKNFTLVIITGLICSIFLCITGVVFTRPLARMLGASEALMEYCVPYLRILSLFAPAYVLQVMFQTYFVTAGRPSLGLFLTVGAGILNAVLDYIFIVPLQMGISGAAWATVAGYLIPAVVGVIFFARHRGLRFAVPRWKPRVILQSCSNGASEMVSNLAASVITFLFNIYMMRYLGEIGVASITIVLYAQFLFTALFLGFSGGIAPLFSYQYGAGNTSELQNLYRICKRFILISSAVIFVSALLGSRPVAAFFAGNDHATFAATLHGSYLFAPSYLFTGLNIFASSLFTALSNGRVSALISFLRTFVFILLGFLILPLFLQVDGVWLSVPAAELCTLVISVWFLRHKKKTYHYAP